MKKNRFIVGIASLVLVFGLIVIGCDNGTTDEEPNPFIGMWERTFRQTGNNGTSTGQYTITKTDWTFLYNGENDTKGTYTYEGNVITFLETHEWEDNTWELLDKEDQYSKEYRLSSDGKSITSDDGKNIYNKIN
jgi:hypothetical protein